MCMYCLRRVRVIICIHEFFFFFFKLGQLELPRKKNFRRVMWQGDSAHSTRVPRARAFIALILWRRRKIYSQFML